MPLMREFCGPLILQALPGQNTIMKYNEIKLVHWRRLASPNRPLKVDCGRRSASDHHKCIIRRISKAFTTQWWEKVLSNNFPNVTIIGEMSATAQLCSSLSGWALSSHLSICRLAKILWRYRDDDWIPAKHFLESLLGVCNPDHFNCKDRMLQRADGPLRVVWRFMFEQGVCLHMSPGSW